MLSLFETSKPFKVQRLKVSELHELSIESTKSKRSAVVFLHGGPGADFQKKLTDILTLNIIISFYLISGGLPLSTPFACLKENTTWDLVEDIEKIRKFLKISKCLYLADHGEVPLASRTLKDILNQ